MMKPSSNYRISGGERVASGESRIENYFSPAIRCSPPKTGTLHRELA